MKKKVLIVTHFMEIGGAERALLGLLNGFDYSKYDVYLFLFRHEGPLFSLIPKEVKILPEIRQYTTLARPISGVIREGHFLLAASRIWGKYAAKLYDKVHHFGENSQVAIEYSHKYTKWLMPKITPNIHYDAAISFLTPHYFVAEKVSASKKIAWIHTDYSYVQINKKSEEKMWNAYDHIVAISESSKKSFLQCFPRLTDKVTVIENLLPVDFIEREADAYVPEKLAQTGKLTLLSVGRYTAAKNFDNVPDICRQIIEHGINVVWYIIGFGPDENLIRKKIAENHMQEHVILLGKKDNPYPYIKQCDWYVQPSRFEGKAVTVCEAQALHKPVIITDYPTSKSQLKNGYDGIIVPLQNDECAKSMVKIFQNRQLKKIIEKNTYSEDYSNRAKMKNVYDLIS